MAWPILYPSKGVFPLAKGCRLKDYAQVGSPVCAASGPGNFVFKCAHPPFSGSKKPPARCRRNKEGQLFSPFLCGTFFRPPRPPQIEMPPPFVYGDYPVPDILKGSGKCRSLFVGDLLGNAHPALKLDDSLAQNSCSIHDHQKRGGQ